MLILFFNLVVTTIAGTAILYHLLPENRKEWSILPILFIGALAYIGITGGIALGTWLMISAFVGSGIGPGIVIGGLWLTMTFGVARMWVNG